MASPSVKALLDLADQRERSCEAVDVIGRAHLSKVKRKLADLAALAGGRTVVMQASRIRISQTPE